MGENRKIILICGPESSGKSTSALRLHKRLGGFLLPDYSRFYLAANGKNYTLSDIHLMANIHKNQLESIRGSLILLDSYLLNYKIWIQEKFDTSSEKISQELKHFKPDLCLLMKPDIPWTYDPLRENQYDRHVLFDMYKNELDNYNWPVKTVQGSYDLRNELIDELKIY